MRSQSVRSQPIRQVAGQPTGRRRPRAATLVALLTVALTVCLLVAPAGAATTVLRGHDPADLAITVSAATVPSGSAGTAVVVADDDGALLPAVASALGGLPRPSPLLLTASDRLDTAVLAELDRATGGSGRYGGGATVYLVGDRSGHVADELTAHGYAVVRIAGSDPATVATALATATYGVPAGTSQRVVLADAADPFAVAAADVYGANVGVPVIPVDADVPDTGVFLRDVVVVASPARISDEAAAGAGDGSPTVTRVWDDDHMRLSVALADLLAAEPGEGDPPPAPHAVAPVVASGTRDPSAGALAAMVAARQALDGNDAPLLLTGGSPLATARACDGGAGGTTCPLDSVDGDVTVLLLPGDAGADGRPDVAAASAVLPTTGGGRAGLALGLLLAGGASSVWLGRRRA